VIVLTTEKYVSTSVSIRPDQKKIIQQLHPQKLSENVRYLIDALIAGIDLEELPPDVAEQVVYSRMIGKIKFQNIQKELEMKEEFFRFLDGKKFPKFISIYSKRKCFDIAKDLAHSYRKFEGQILPECYTVQFISEYYELRKGSPEMIEAYIERYGILKEADEVAEGGV
jgi:hypothetical protein